MLKREFRRKYPCNPDEGSKALGNEECNRLTVQQISTSKHYRPNLPSIQDVRKVYCKRYGYNLDQYMDDWRSIERINPRTKKFYKSKKYQ